MTTRFSGYEGSKAALTSKEMEIKLTNVARALEREFVTHGGLRKRMYKARQQHRRTPPKNRKRPLPLPT